MSFLKGTWHILAGVSAILGLLAFFALLPKVSVNAYDSINPKDPFDTVFTLENGSLFAIKDITAKANLEKVENMHNGTLGPLTLLSHSNDAETLSAGKTTSIQIQLKRVGIEGFDPPYKVAIMNITIEYTYLGFKLTARERFEMLQRDNGDTFWVPKNS